MPKVWLTSAVNLVSGYKNDYVKEARELADSFPLSEVGSIGPLFRFTEARGSISNVTEKSSLNLVYIPTCLTSQLFLL